LWGGSKTRPVFFGVIGFAVPKSGFALESRMHRFQKWRDLIQAAGNESAIQGVMEEYVSSIPVAVISTLPEECQRALEESPLDIQGTAVTLTHCELTYKGDPEVQAYLHEVAHTFAVASMRIVRFGRDPIIPAGAQAVPKGG
jgi:hypothetical protein